MVGKSLELLAGEVRIRVRGGSVERFLNVCARGGIRLRRTKRVDFGELTATVSVRDFRRLRGVMGRTGCRVRIIGRRGLPFVLHGLRGRYIFFAGFAAVFALFIVLTNFVWVVDVSAQPGISTYALRETLRRAGAYSGVPIRAVDETAIRHYVRTEMRDTVDYVTVSRIGNVISVEAFGGDGDIRPVDDKAVTGVVAARDGLITRMNVTGGYPLVARGDAVERGQLLVSAVTPPTTEAGEGHIGHGMARIEAQTLRKETSVRPLTRTEKRYTGKKKTQFALVVGGRRINLYFGSGMGAGACDKRVTTRRLQFGRGVALPISLVQQEYTLYAPQTVIDRPEDVQPEMEERALLRMGDDMQEGGEVQRWQSHAVLQDGALRLSLHADCTEEIGVEISEEGAVLPPKPDGEEDAE